MTQNNKALSGHVPKWGQYPVYSQGVIQNPETHSVAALRTVAGDVEVQTRHLACEKRGPLEAGFRVGVK